MKRLDARLTEPVPNTKFRIFDVLQLERAGSLVLRVEHELANMIAQVYELGTAYFRLSLDYKLKDRVSHEFGFRPTGVEYSQSPDRPDPFESFSASVRMESSRISSTEGRRLYQQMLTTTTLFEPIAEAIVRGIATAMHADADSLRGAMHRWSVMQLNYSRPAKVTTPFIHESHEDGHVLTLAAATGPGLEIADSAGRFQATAMDARSLLVMPGEILYLLSGGRVRPLVHRVVPLPRVPERLALLFFADLDPRVCAPWVVNNINADVNIGHHVLTNAERFGLAGYGEE